MKLKHSYFGIQESNLWSYLNSTNHFGSYRATKLNVAFSPCRFAQFHVGTFFLQKIGLNYSDSIRYKSILV